MLRFSVLSFQRIGDFSYSSYHLRSFGQPPSLEMDFCARHSDNEKLLRSILGFDGLWWKCLKRPKLSEVEALAPSISGALFCPTKHVGVCENCITNFNGLLHITHADILAREMTCHCHCWEVQESQIMSMNTHSHNFTTYILLITVVATAVQFHPPFVIAGIIQCTTSSNKIDSTYRTCKVSCPLLLPR